MARPRRVKFDDPETGSYHIISRAIQKEFRLKQAEKEKFLSLLRWLSGVYFVRVATFSLMSNHIHLIIKMIRKSDISEAELQRRFDRYYNSFAMDDQRRELNPMEIPHYYERFSDISRFMQDLKQRFSRWYNEVHKGFGHVWADRFKSVLLLSPRALRACMIYVELNAVRAGIVKEPEKYPYCGLAYYMEGGRKGAWLSFSLLGEMMEAYDELVRVSITPVKKGEKLVSRYFTLVYQEGLNLKSGKASIPQEIWANKMTQLPDEVLDSVYLARIPQLTNGIMLGDKEKCEEEYAKHKEHFKTKRLKKAKPLFEESKEKNDKSSPLSWLNLQEVFSLRSYDRRS